MTPGWLQAALAREDATDICLNGPEQSFWDLGFGLQPIAGAAWTEEEMRGWVLERISACGKSWDAKYPFLDGTLAETGHRLHVAFPPLARSGILISLRRLPRKSSTSNRPLETSRRWSGSPGYAVLKDAVLRGESVLVCGATGAGKTTLARDLLSEVPPLERVIALEDTPELSPDHPHFLSLVSRPPNADGFGEVTLRDLLRQALRMRPDRIVLGECRGGEVLDLLQLLNTGHQGAIATLHANSPRDALRRVELLCLLAAQGSIPPGIIRELLASGVQWLAQVTKKKITEICRVEGREGDTILLRPVVKAESP